jgi:hypothetical protein
MKKISELIKQLISLSVKSLDKYNRFEGKYKNFDHDIKKIEKIKDEIINSDIKTFKIKTFDRLIEDELNKIDEDYRDVINEDLVKIKNILNSKHEEYKIIEEKIQTKKDNKNNSNASEKNKTKSINLDTSNSVIKINLSNQNRNYLMIAISIVLAILFFTSISSDKPSYNKNNKWVKNCLDLGFKKNSEVAKCAERQELAHYEYLKIKNENERIKNELAQANQYQKKILEEQRRANDMQSNQMLLNLSQELMGLNNNNNRSFNCITNPVGWSCR